MSVRSPASFDADRRKPKQKCVLIVEDNHLDTALFSALIESQGHQVLKAGNAAEGGGRDAGHPHYRHLGLWPLRR